jgi:hypothetical protein
MSLVVVMTTITESDRKDKGGGPTRFPRVAQEPPVVPKALPVPRNDRARQDERQGLLPARPQPREPDPARATRGREPRAWGGLLVGSKLMPQGHVFQTQ